MTAVLIRVTALTAVYLLALTSLAPGDIVTGVVIATLLVTAGRWVRFPASIPSRSPDVAWGRRLAGVPALIGGTVVDMARESWQIAGHCLRGRLPAPGLVTVPIRRDAPVSAAAWGIRVGLAPASVVVEVDDARGQLLLHVPDARDPDAVRRAQLLSYERRQARVFP
ncbi:Multisubunit Na+/H+ antiporter, MnhE subunit [Modestobacter italicus]|uniref:Multisubunit Na+/H+ antiporter, MnhE subunit n=1 Tax=Modestobacter italicus (strain DSM 44449 / CECT 9708 / BC 501) TaxID=2732864 RepID=I4EYG8_MODI5|nr:Na+/H+ antiporter subunit E [Modestobacter marinus]CCH88431.1 Multisubunit Na+/H+ antiporter, MnhE subunit [Modestobacter marinus]